jgi:anti-sigma regulatory factor (Ser/Thr protein kinase)
VPLGTGATPAPKRDKVVSQGLSHQALIYSSETQLADATAAFVRLGLEVGDPVLVVARPQSLNALRAELGSDADLIELHESTAWFPHPFQRLQELRRLVAEVREGNFLRVIDERVLGRSGASAREWARYDSVINRVLAEAPLRLVCLFHESSLPQPVLAAAVRTHPELIEKGAAVASAEFVPPGRFLPGTPPAPPDGAVTLPLPWSELRVAVREHAERLGMTPERADDVVLAVQEVATNADLHGAPPVRAQLWEHDGELVCQVVDGGAGGLDPLTGWVPPDDPGGSGWGLPIARLTCDAVEIGAGTGRTVVTLFMSLDR